ncbi:hypothetical protein GJ699_21775 [Duganella sp. FT80W]|uniref:Uncharacterized protein n=1 Tax=Duganella guangzhouensis TaxID=2666084 RepID=A0A6I2L425_9BURK|nr:hypothetical protein [Duganella guangzhouensis]MRW92633.1 hypothetical protein [Duganella guangzhouensis]
MDDRKEIKKPPSNYANVFSLRSDRSPSDRGKPNVASTVKIKIKMVCDKLVGYGTDINAGKDSAILLWMSDFNNLIEYLDTLSKSNKSVDMKSYDSLILLGAISKMQEICRTADSVRANMCHEAIPNALLRLLGFKK